MAVLKFRVFLEDDDTVYRDIAIQHKQSFLDLHKAILQAYEFDQKHKASFYRSNEYGDKGRAISLEAYPEIAQKVPPLIMAETPISSEIKETNQYFLYEYDFVKNWLFRLQLIQIIKEEDPKLTYPATTRKEGIGPQQYGIRSMLGPRFAEIEEKYDLTDNTGFGEEGEDAGQAAEDFSDGEEL